MRKIFNHSVLTREQMSALLRQYGIMITQQRVEMALLLFNQHQHVSADDILTTLNQHQPIVSKATVYNTLGLFVEKGLIRQVIVDPSKVFYDSNTREHHHFYNVDTGTLIDIEHDHLELINMPNLPAGTQAEGLDIIIRIRNQTNTNTTG